MTIKADIHIHYHDDRVDEIIKILNKQTEILNKQSNQLIKIMATLSEVQELVAAENTVIDSAIVLLQNLAAQVAALTPSQAAIDALAADITAKTNELATAVTTNTPAA